MLPSTMPASEVRPRRDKPGVDLISDALRFGRLLYGEPNATTNAISCAKLFSCSHEHAGPFKEWVRCSSIFDRMPYYQYANELMCLRFPRRAHAEASLPAGAGPPARNEPPRRLELAAQTQSKTTT